MEIAESKRSMILSLLLLFTAHVQSLSQSEADTCHVLLPFQALEQTVLLDLFCMCRYVPPNNVSLV